MSTVAPHRVVVADDSAFMRHVLTSALRADDTEIVGVAADGDQALELCERERPDVLSLDLAMPGRDGIGVLRGLRERHLDVPVVVVSAFSPEHGVRAVDALAEGAFELVAKPTASEGLDAFVAELGSKVRAAAQVGMRRRRRRAPLDGPGAPTAPTSTPGPASARVAPAAPAAPPLAPRVASTSAAANRVVVIACSTGGPRALAELLPRLPGSIGRGVVIVQHMPSGFTSSLAARLDRASALGVQEAHDGDPLDPSCALLAAGGSHLRLDADGRMRLSDEPAIGGLRPRADLTIDDAVRLWGERVVLVVLTGMGKDGLAGAREVRKAGGRILVEAESSCVVYGMPRAISEAHLADHELDLADLPAAIAAEVGR